MGAFESELVKVEELDGVIGTWMYVPEKVHAEDLKAIGVLLSKWNKIVQSRDIDLKSVEIIIKTPADGLILSPLNRFIGTVAIKAKLREVEHG